MAMAYIHPDELLASEDLTIRDYFAAQALTALVMAGPHHEDLRDEQAAQAYDIADAMLKRRRRDREERHAMRKTNP